MYNEPITEYGDRPQTRSFSYVCDTFGSDMTAITSVKEGVYNISNNREMGVMDLASHVKKITGSE